MGCWGLVVYAATAAVCSGKTQTLFPFLDLNSDPLTAAFTYKTNQSYNQTFSLILLSPATLHSLQ